MAENLPEGAGIWYLSSAAGVQECIDRQEGMENWLQAYDTVDCAVGSTDLFVLGAIEAAKVADRMYLSSASFRK